MKRMFFLLLVTILLTGCAAPAFPPTPSLPPTAKTPNTLPEPTDPTQLITLTAGETFDVVLPSNSSTGYRWDILPELDIKIVEFVEQGYIAEQPVMPGSGGMDVWTFRAVNTGETTSLLAIIRPAMKRTRRKP